MTLMLERLKELKPYFDRFISLEYSFKVLVDDISLDYVLNYFEKNPSNDCIIIFKEAILGDVGSKSIKNYIEYVDFRQAYYFKKFVNNDYPYHVCITIYLKDSKRYLCVGASKADVYLKLANDLSLEQLFLQNETPREEDYGPAGI